MIIILLFCFPRREKIYKRESTQETLGNASTARKYVNEFPLSLPEIHIKSSVISNSI